MDWTYTEERRWKHRQHNTGVEFVGETEERAPHTKLEENTNGEKVHIKATERQKNRTSWKSQVEDLHSTKE